MHARELVKKIATTNINKYRDAKNLKMSKCYLFLKELLKIIKNFFFIQKQDQASQEYMNNSDYNRIIWVDLEVSIFEYHFK